DAFAGLFSKMLNPQANIGVLSRQTELVRLRARAAFAIAVRAADDAPRDDSATQLIQGLYAAHLALLLLWSQDRSPESKSTHAALNLFTKLLSQIRRARWLPGSGGLLDSIGEICGPLVDPPADLAHTRKATEILRLVFRHRRLLPNVEKCKAAGKDGVCDLCLEPHLPLVRRFLGANIPVHFVLPAFPAKSPNPEKVLGRFPDMAEELSLRFLNNLCAQVSSIYPPGARITICSDGLVFSDLVTVADSDVIDYGRRISQFIAQLNLQNLDTFHLQDLYDGVAGPNQMRESLCMHYAETRDAIRTRLHSNENQQALFNGIQRFLFEDRVAIEKDKSRSRIRNECKDRTYELIRRSDAWGRLVADCFPASLRFSIHPQPAHSEKIGILLGESRDVWLTPWHAVALKEKDRFVFVKRREALDLGASVVEKNSQPYYMELSR
ncbi:MAG TPA: isocyanide synthase family protein, partial [Candidatus Acidoferrum sp.]|nr:isocyanide synthase family protein [Candidatus Acidoferrum sp.]